MDETVKRIAGWLRGERHGPVQLQFNPTDRCNLLCRFCWLRDTSRVDYSNQVSDDRYRELVEEAGRLGVQSVTITGGGEPMVRKELTLSLMESIKSRGMTGSMITNGTLLGEGEARRIAEAGWDELIISLDSHRAETHDYLRSREGAFEKTVTAARLLAELRDASGKGRPKICFHFVLCNENYAHIPEFVDFSAGLGCSNIFLEPLVVGAFEDDAGEKLRLSEAQKREAQRFIRKGLDLCGRHGIENNFESLLEPELIEGANRMDEVIAKDAEADDGIPTPCFEPWYNMIIRPNGRTGPCCMFDYSGEYAHDRSLEEIWYGEYFQSIRDQLMQGQLPLFCSQCNPSQVAGNRRIRAALRNYL